jgi:ABC-type multidrug transport system fused ATPase/permease subunit
MKNLYNIFVEYKGKLSLIYLFMLLTELTIITQPMLLGKSIDGLLINNYNWLILLSVSYLASTFFMYRRMIYDTKVYTLIYNNIVLRFIGNTKTCSSTKIARADMATDIVAVLEGHVHYYISTIITIVGSIWFIYMSNWLVGITISIAFVFILLGVLLFYKKIKQSINVRNNHQENKVKSFSTSHTDTVSFLYRQRRLDIYESTLQGKNWSVATLFRSIFLIISIILLVKTSENITIGSIITVYSYVNNFLISLLSIPVAFEMYSRMTNILKRLY